MIVLDTNVLSELMRERPETAVLRWMAEQPPSSLFLTSVTQAEILHGLALLPAGHRRTALSDAAGAMFREDFAGRILPFGTEAAPLYALIAAERSRAGQPISQFDAQIAAVTRSAGASLATRNVRDFHGCGIKLIDPWS